MSLIHDRAVRNHLLEAFGCGNIILEAHTGNIFDLHRRLKGNVADYTHIGMAKSNMSGTSGTSSSAPEIKF